MRLLICAQAVDSNDLALGFFVTWVRELSSRFDAIHVVALSAGTYGLPNTVRVHSLGKDNSFQLSAFSFQKFARRIRYAAEVLRLAWRLRREYDVVFVHQNQEYVLLGGLLWKMLGKRVYLWRNHYAGSFLTNIAVALSTKVFCTSKHSYTAKFPKTSLMPVGVDTELFTNAEGMRAPRSILYFARFAPSKRPDMLIEALGILKSRRVQFTATIVGSALPEDRAYRERAMRRARELGLSDVTFHEGVPHQRAPAIFASHEIFVNLSESGMYDKTIFEAAASGCIVAAASDDLADMSGYPVVSAEPHALAEQLRALLELPPESKASRVEKLRSVARQNSLQVLMGRLAERLQ